MNRVMTVMKISVKIAVIVTFGFVIVNLTVEVIERWLFRSEILKPYKHFENVSLDILEKT